MSSGNFSKKPTNAQSAINVARSQASHGDFFFARWSASDGYVRESPCFVISDDPHDPHDEIIILKCTSQPKRTDFDVEVTCLRKPSLVRTSKIYTIQRKQLLFPLSASLDLEEYKAVMKKLAQVQGLSAP